MVGRSEGHTDAYGGIPKGPYFGLSISPVGGAGFGPFRLSISNGGFSVEIADIVALYVECIRIALPFTIVFYLGEFITSTILRTAFGGKLTFKSF